MDKGESVHFLQSEHRGTDAASKVAWKLTPEVAKHIELVFTSQASLCKLLGTNPKTWRDLTTGNGVRENTARAVAIDFALFLKRASEGKVKSDTGAFRDEIVALLIDQYAPYVAKLDFDPLLEPVAA